MLAIQVYGYLSDEAHFKTGFTNGSKLRSYVDAVIRKKHAVLYSQDATLNEQFIKTSSRMEQMISLVKKTTYHLSDTGQWENEVTRLKELVNNRANADEHTSQFLAELLKKIESLESLRNTQIQVLKDQIDKIRQESAEQIAERDKSVKMLNKVIGDLKKSSLSPNPSTEMSYIRSQPIFIASAPQTLYGASQRIKSSEVLEVKEHKQAYSA
jgi:hypothetical protein